MLLPLALGIYFLISGIIESIKQKRFKLTIVYGLILTFLGAFFAIYILLSNVKG
jgi:uncharacterized membrane protein HdeD (DUF308 family)